jgi:hypothetical protein
MRTVILALFAVVLTACNMQQPLPSPPDLIRNIVDAGGNDLDNVAPADLGCTNIGGLCCHFTDTWHCDQPDYAN